MRNDTIPGTFGDREEGRPAHRGIVHHPLPQRRDKCYGGDVRRSRKLFQKHKKRVKAVGSVKTPQEAPMAVLDHRE